MMGKDIALLSALRRKRLCVWSAGGRTNLLLVEVLLVLITADQARAEPASTALPVPQGAREIGARDIRQLDIRQFLVRSLVRTPAQRMQSASKATAARMVLYPGSGITDQRSLQSLLLRPVVDYPASRFADARAQMRNVRSFTGAGFKQAAVVRNAAPAPLSAPSARPTMQAPAAPPPQQVVAAEPVAAAVPVPRNPDVQPDRNLDRLAPTAAEKPAAETYDQAGIKLGNFLYKPAVEILGGYASNPGRQPNAAPSPVVVVAPELSIRSQFERHELNADMRFAYNEVTAQQTLSHPTAEARVNGRYDLNESTHLVAEGRFLNDTLVTPGFVQQPRTTTFGTTAGVVQKFDSLEIAAKGSFDRVTFANGMIAPNQVLNTQDRNYNQPGAQTRISYAVSPEISPFIDLGYDRREHDMKVDFNGVRRDSTGLLGRGGVALNLGSLSGDMSFGYLVRRFDAPNMRNVEGWVADATLVWAADPTTTFVLVARSQSSETPAANIFGILSRDVILQVDHQFEPWLVATLRSGYGQDRFVGTDRIDNRFFVAGGGVYKLSRMVHLKSDLRAEWTRSSLPMNNVVALTGLLGVRFQY
jgi:hypothetical protein